MSVKINIFGRNTVPVFSCLLMQVEELLSSSTCINNSLQTALCSLLSASCPPSVWPEWTPASPSAAALDTATHPEPSWPEPSLHAACRTELCHHLQQRHKHTVSHRNTYQHGSGTEIEVEVVMCLCGLVHTSSTSVFFCVVQSIRANVEVWMNPRSDKCHIAKVSGTCNTEDTEDRGSETDHILEYIT